MWKLQATEDFERSRKWYAKKRRRELQAVLDNLEAFMKALEAGSKVQQVKAGFIHPEPRGVLAIDQKGGGKYLQQVRLYVYPDEQSETVHLLNLGDKQSQHDDIQMCEEFVERLRSAKPPEKPDDPESA